MISTSCDRIKPRTGINQISFSASGITCTAGTLLPVHLTFKRDITIFSRLTLHLDGADYQSLHKDVDVCWRKPPRYRCESYHFSGGDDAAGYRHMRELVGKRDVVFSLRRASVKSRMKHMT